MPAGMPGSRGPDRANRAVARADQEDPPVSGEHEVNCAVIWRFERAAKLITVCALLAESLRRARR
jgi:hypothetical protein